MKLKIVALFLSCSLIAQAFSQSVSKTDSTGPKNIPTSYPVFSGIKNFNTWSFGINGGVLTPFLLINGADRYIDANVQPGYGFTVRKQLSHSFSLQVDAIAGNFSGTNADKSPSPIGGVTSFNTKLLFEAGINAVVNVATVNFLKRKSVLNFYLLGGFGTTQYSPKIYYTDGSSFDFRDVSGTAKHNQYIHEQLTDLGVGAKLRLSNSMALNLGYTAYFLDGYNLDGLYSYKIIDFVGQRDYFSYAYGGLEYTFGPSHKPNMEWFNPVANMYDQLKDTALVNEVASLNQRMEKVKKDIDLQSKDSDGDGVADQFDKCPNTPAGSIVDGAGCPIVMPVDSSLNKPATDGTALNVKFGNADGFAAGKPNAARGTIYSNIQFDFDSFVLKLQAYSILDKAVADLKTKPKQKITVNGYASSEGTAAHNMVLSTNRAKSVRLYIINGGISQKRVKAVGYGTEDPIADNSTESGRIINRRVEFKIDK